MKPAVLATALLLGCNSATIVVGELHEVALMKAIPNRDLDILFVIDNSPSMLDKQIALAAAFPRMIDVLEQLDDGLPNLHIGVVTSDMGTSASGSAPGPAIGQAGSGGCASRGLDGELQTIPGMAATFLSDVDDNGTRVRNYTGALRDVFGDLARVGAGGCGFEQHLSAMRRALTNPLNGGFLRPHANLAVVILADEDDCSAANAALFGPDSATLGPLHSYRCFQHGVTCDPDVTTPGPKSSCVPREGSPYVEDVQPFVDALLTAKPDPRMLLVAGIVGDPSPVATELRPPPSGGTPVLTVSHACSFTTPTELGVADPAVRLGAFLDAFPDRSTLTSVCSADLTNPLAVIGESTKKLVGDPCLDTTRLADISADPGVQPSCEVVDLTDATGTVTPLDPCSSGASTCFEILPDAQACPATLDHLRVRVQRATAVSDDTWTHVRCQLR